MIQFILDILFPSAIHGVPVSTAIAPLVAAAGISAAGSLLGGFLNNRAINKGYEGLDERIEDVSDPNYYLPQLERIASNNTQGNYNVNAQLARQGVDSPAIASELQEAGQQNRYGAIMGGLDALEGRRQSMLNNLLGLKAGRTQAKSNNISQSVSGVTNSITQGIGAKVAQQNFDRVMNQQQQSFTGQPMNAGQTMGFGENAYDSSMFGGGSFGSNLYGTYTG